MIRAKLPNVEIAGRSESCGKGNCQVCEYICDTDTFTTKACGETFKIQSGILNCNSQKVVYLLKCRICGEACYVGKAKTKFRAKFNNVHRGPIEKNVKFHSSVFINIMDNTVIMELMIGSSHLGNTGLKHFTLVGLMKRKNIYIKSSFLTFLLLGIQFINHFNF